MSRLDHSRTNSRDRMRRQGVDCTAEDSLPHSLRPPKPRPSKAAMRAELVAATAEITRIIRCGCGHQATVAIPAAKLGARLRCTKCGEIAQ